MKEYFDQGGNGLSKEGKVTVVGSNMIDLVAYLDRTPEKGETVFGQGFQQGFGGKGSNQAVMASLLGAEVAMVTAVGDDVYGEEWLEQYKKEGILADAVKVVEGENSGVASIWVESDGDNRIVIAPGANDKLTPEFVNASFKKIPKPDVVLSQLENPQESILEGFKLGKELNAITILNPAPAEPLLEEILTYTDWLVPNEMELAYLAKEMYGIESANPVDLIQAFSEKTNTNIAVTVGAKGALVYMPEEKTQVINVPTIDVEVKDTTGAGDAFCGTFAYGLATGLEPEKAIELANIVASDSVQRNGTQASYARGEALNELMNQIN